MRDKFSAYENCPYCGEYACHFLSVGSFNQLVASGLLSPNEARAHPLPLVINRECVKCHETWQERDV